MRVHHLNCGSLCPNGARLINGEGGWLERGHIVCHCLAIETNDGLVLVDTGFGMQDARAPRQLGPIFGAMNASPKVETTALEQLKSLGFEASDVRRIVTTHLDPDHSGGLPDFPEAEVHILSTELDAAMHPRLRDRLRYLDVHWKHGPHWVRHDVGGDEWLGFESIRILPGIDAEILLIPLAGHSLGHSGVALRTGAGWLLHCGDAYFNHGEVETPPSCPPGLSLFQNLNAADNRTRKSNRERLRELASRHGDEVTLLCSHDPHELEREQAKAGAAAAAE
ncbi:MAG TPA: MBL fold metallo-hydrolase [Solirubrobacterales bacterium]|jgi:glyoxylase-like metal-dependent hydrolase (beta-lactamase superfamily II)|nr:MBL fold metallo-hydrolase [Solirubrobacterales bacterium]